MATNRYVSVFESGVGASPWGLKLFESDGSELRLDGTEWRTQAQAEALSPPVSFTTMRLLSSSGSILGLASSGFIYSGADVGEVFISNAGPLTTDLPYSPDPLANDCTSSVSTANASFATATYVANTTVNGSLSPPASMTLISSIGQFGLNQRINPITLKASGSGSYSYSVTSGTLPQGISLDGAAGVLSGIPTAAGAYSFQVTATEGGNSVATQTYTGNVFNFLTFENGALRFGNGSQHSVNAIGLFEQPFYWSALSSRYFKLTYSSYPLDMAIGTGTGGSNWSGSSVVELSAGLVTAQTFDYSGYSVISNTSTTSKGYGRIIVRTTFTINAQSVEVKHVYTLGQTDNFVKIETTSTNKAASSISNMHIWVGTRDDYVGSSDSPTKTKGNLDGVDGAFRAVANAATQARALQITTSNEGALFYSTTAGANMSVDGCCQFSNAFNRNPNQTQPVTGPADGSYAAVLPVGNLAIGAAAAITWFYAAGALQDLGNVAKSVAAAAAPPAPTVVRGDKTATISWLAPEVEAGSSIIGYNYRYSTDGGSTWITPPTTLDTSRTYQVTGLTNTSNYIFQVRAIAQVGSDVSTRANGAWSASSTGSILGAPNAPALTSATGGNQQITLVFTAPSSPISPITSYEYCIDSCSSPSATWTNFRGSNPDPSAPVPTSPFIISDFTNGLSYSIQMRAKNIHGAGNSSESRTALTKPTWTTSAFSSLTRGTSVSFDLVAQSTVTYQVTGGALPAGLSLSSAGRVSGTPSAGGTYSVTITATNSGGSTARTFTGNVTPYWIPTTTTIRGTVGSQLNDLVESSNAVGLSFVSSGGTVTVSTLPEGVSFQSIGVSTAGTAPAIRFTGAATTAGTYTVTVTFTDSAGKTVSAVITIEIGAAVSSGSGSGSGSGSVGTPLPMPTPNVTPRPIPRPTPSLAPRPNVSPSPVAPQVSPTPMPQAPRPIEPAQLIPILERTPNASFSRTNPVPTEIANVLARPLAYEVSAAGRPSLPELTPTQSLAYENGSAVGVELVRNRSESGYILNGDGWVVNLEATDTTGTPLVLDNSGNIILNEERAVSFSGTGFAPGSTIRVWLFSDPSELMTVVADANGNFSGTTTLPVGIPEGQHTVQLNGLSKDGQVRSVSLGVVVQPDLIPAPVITPFDFAPLLNLVLVTAGVVMMFLLVLVARKRWFLLAAKRRKRTEERAELKAGRALAKKQKRQAARDKILFDEIDPFLAQQVALATPSQQFPVDSRRKLGHAAPPKKTKGSPFKRNRP
jgi:hypothetical protein